LVISGHKMCRRSKMMKKERKQGLERAKSEFSVKGGQKVTE